MLSISVIIPVYNAEHYLRRCLESVCNQTLKDIEIICVNDASTDSSAEILQEYRKNYKNLTVVNLEKNQGESSARNTGIALAKGEYLGFVDNDDEIDLNFYEKLYEKAKKEDADIAKAQTIQISDDCKKNVAKQLTPKAHKLFFADHWWSAIYKRSLISENNISFSTKHILGGDLLFLTQALLAAKNIALVEETYYHYYRREDSGNSKILSEEKIRSALDAYGIIIDNIIASINHSDEIYGFMFHHYIVGSFYLSLRNFDRKNKKLCVQSALNIFEKCQNKDALPKHFSYTTPHLIPLLNNQNVEEITDILAKCKTRMEIIAPGLRSRIKTK